MSEKKNAIGNLGLWIIGATIAGAITGLVMGESAKALAPIRASSLTPCKEEEDLPLTI